MAPSAAEDARDSSDINLKPPPGDLSVMFLGNIFGVVDGVLAGTGSQIAGTLFGVFNSAVLALGGIIISYTLMLSTINTAQDGQFLGQRMSSIWVPLRTVGGAMLLMPKASGYCVMQIFIMWIVVQGIGAADKVWAQALSYLNRGGAIVRPNVDPITSMSKNNDSSVFNGAYGMFVGQVCMGAMQRGLARYRRTVNSDNTCATTSDPAMSSFCKTPVPNFIDSINFFDDSLAAANPITINMPTLKEDPYTILNGICGSIQFDAFSLGDSATPGVTNAEEMGLTESQEGTLNSSRNVAMSQMYEFLSIVANQVVDNDKNFNLEANGFPWGLPLTVELAKCTADTNPYTTDKSGCTGCDGITTYKNSACLSWELENGAMEPVLLRGTEIQDAVATYNGMMSASLFIKSQVSDSGNYKLQRDFLSKAQSSGWLLAGAYYFRLAILTSQVLQASSDSGVGNDDQSSNLAVCSPSSGGGCVNWTTSGLSDKFTTTSSTLCDGSTPLISDVSASNTIFCNADQQNKIQVLTDAVTFATQLIKGDSTLSSIPDVISNVLKQPTYSNGSSYPTADSAYGFLINSTALVLPGQPGNQQPEFTMSVDFNATTNVPQLGKSTVSGGKWNIPGQIITFIYNSVLREFFNMMLSLVIPMVNMMFFAFIQPPLVLLARCFFRGD